MHSWSYNAHVMARYFDSKSKELVAQFDVPVNPNDVTVTHADKHTTVTLAYVRPVELAPGFVYPWAFSLNIDTYTTKPTSLQDLGVPK